MSKLIKLTGDKVDIHRFPVDSGIKDAMIAAASVPGAELTQQQWLRRAILEKLAREGWDTIKAAKVN